MRAAPRVPRPVATAVAVAAFGVLLALALAFAGLLQQWSVEPARAAPTSVEVVSGVPCDRPGTPERVGYTVDGERREADLDACGHADGETVQVTVDGDGDTVHLARATPGAAVDARPLGLMLAVLACLAGAGFARLVRPRPPVRSAGRPGR